MYDSGHDGEGGKGGDDGVAALTFFTLSPPSVKDEDIAKQCALQLGEMWDMYGQSDTDGNLRKYSASTVHRWPNEAWVTDETDPSTVHPHPGPVRVLARSEWGGLLHFASTETDQEDAGVMEGAVGAAQRVLKELSKVA